MSPERSRELADLRRRAYGPGADIARDPGAVARLHELEALSREEEPAVSVPQEPAVREAPAPPAETARPSAPAAAEPATALTSPAVTARSPWWRRVPVWSIAVVSAVVGALIALSAVNLAADHPDATLEPAARAPETPTQWDELLRGWDVDPSTTQSFGDFRQIDVWEVRSRIGAPCILLSSRGRPFALGCASRDLDPIVDFTVQSGMLGILNDELRDGMLLRFIAREDRVDVWVREPPAREAQSIDTSWADSLPRMP